MKRIIALHIMILSAITFVGNFSFAQTTSAAPDKDTIEAAYCKNQSSICGTAPEQFTFLMDFAREMSNAMKTMWTQWEYLGKFINPNRFQWNTFVAPPKQTIVGKLAKNISQKVKFAMASLAIFSNLWNFGGLKDMVWWFALLAKNQVFLRDTKLVEKIESQINDKKYELWIWWWRYEEINVENVAVMQAIIQKYIDKWLLQKSSRINPGTSYNNITSLLTQALSAAKSFLYFGNIDKFTAMGRGNPSDGIFLEFTTGAMAKIEREYNCARWPNYVCSSESKKFIEWMKKMWQGLSIWSASTTKTFTDAVDRLWEVFSKTKSKEFQAREAELLKSMYGNQKVSTSSGFKWLLIDPFKKSVDSVKKTLDTASSQIADLATDIDTFRTFPKDLKGTFEGTLGTGMYIQSDYDMSRIEDGAFSEIMNNYTSGVLNSQDATLRSVSMTEVKTVTPAFKVLWDQIASIRNNILGGKDKQNSLISSLWAACELQCGRFWLCR